MLIVQYFLLNLFCVFCFELSIEKQKSSPFLFWSSREYFLAWKCSSCGSSLEILWRYSSSICLSKSLEEILIFFGVRKSLQFVKYRFKATIISIISTMLAKIQVIHELIEALFYTRFCVLSQNLVHNQKSHFEFTLFKSIMSIDSIHLPTASCY